MKTQKPSPRSTQILWWVFGLPVINHVATADATAHLLVQVAEVTPS